MENKLSETLSGLQLLLVEKGVRLLPSMIQKTGPVSFFVVGELLHQSLQQEDDGTASFLLNAGAELFYILEDPIRVQICLRNIFEMSFDGMERVTQREWFEKLCPVRLLQGLVYPEDEKSHLVL